MTTTTEPAPLAIIGTHVGQTATRFLMNDGSYVVALDDGRYCCIKRECIDKRMANDCQHVRLVKDADRTATGGEGEQ